MPVSAVSTYAAFFGNFDAGCLIGDRMSVEISVSEEAYWANDITAVKGVTRYDIQAHDIAGSSAGAVVGLKPLADILVSRGFAVVAPLPKPPAKKATRKRKKPNATNNNS